MSAASRQYKNIKNCDLGWNHIMIEVERELSEAQRRVVDLQQSRNIILDKIQNGELCPIKLALGDAVAQTPADDPGAPPRHEISA
jgi:hypothetical protein